MCLQVIAPSLGTSLVVRIGLMMYGLWQDSIAAVKYTDIDYYVFTDAAGFIVKGQSPYRRTTYRYTPLLAWILQPNIWWNPIFGKLLFIFCDVFAGYLIHCIVRRTSDVDMSRFCAQIWLFNPLPMIVSSRGNAESLMAVLVLVTLYLLNKQHTSINISLLSMVYGLSVHMKIYPVTYVMPIYLLLVNEGRGSGIRLKLKQLLGFDFLPTWKASLFLFVTAIVISTLTFVCYYWCGFEFIQETYLYHVTRRDTRHNFSPYFYMLYLTEGSEVSIVLGLLAFIPQLALLLVISMAFYEDMSFCCFLHTFVFVSFNKVCTSQYFLWYLCLLPLVIPKMYTTFKEACCLLCLWFGAQGVWLLSAYFLEFTGKNTFILIWLAGLAFLLINVWILHRVIQMYNPVRNVNKELLKLKDKHM